MTVGSDVLARYVAVLENLRPGGLDALDTVMAPDVAFRDPFNAVTGIDKVKRIFAALFADCTDVSFRVTRSFDGGDRAALLWVMSYRLRYPRARRREVEGMSLVGIDRGRGLITAHIDHWDAAGQFYETLPLLGTLLRLIRRRLRVR